MTNTQSTAKPHYDLSSLTNIMSTLRSPQGCPWDQRQTPESLKPYILEEAYELLEAIDGGNPHNICDELGDLLLQIVFLAQMYSEKGIFDLSDVIYGICSKMIRRHPHVFAGADSSGHRQRWEHIKTRELEKSGQPQQLAKRLPASLPALKRTQKFIKKTAPAIATDQQLNLLIEGQEHLCKEIRSSSSHVTIEKAVAQQLTDLVGLAVSLHIDAEDALRKITTAKIAEIDSTK